MRITLATAFAAATLCLSGTAFAHAHLTTATPAVDSTVAAAPAEVVINYTEGLEPKFSTVVVTDAAGAQVDKGDLHLDPANNKRVIVGLKPLKPGVYKVNWHATAVDTHKTEGTYSFTVSP